MAKYDDIIRLIDNKLADLNDVIDLSILDYDNEIKSIISFILNNNINEDIDLLNGLDIDNLKLILPNTFSKDLRRLTIYIKSLSNSYRDSLNNPEVIADIRNTLNSIKDYLIELDNENNKKKEKITNDKKEKEVLEGLKNRLISGQPISRNDINLVISLIEKIDNKKDAIQLLVSFSNNVINQDYSNDNEEKIKEELDKSVIIEVNENTKNMENRLIEVFSSHGLSFEDLTTKNQRDLSMYGNIDLIDSILGLFDSYNINLNEIYGNKKIISFKSQALTDVLLFANKGSVESILKLAADKLFFREDNKIDIISLLERPSRFLNRCRRSYRLGNGKIENINGGEYFGCFEDFIANIEFFEKMGISMQQLCNQDITDSRLLTKSLAEKPHTHIIRNKETFDMYGIDKSIYLGKLSCFYPTNPADIIDQFIELGLYDYIISNFSKVAMSVDDIRFYKIIYALKIAHMDKNSMLTETKQLREKKYLDLNPIIASINDLNKKSILNYYEPLSDYEDGEIIKKTFDDVLKKKGGSTSLEVNEASIINLLDEKFLLKNENNEIIIPNIYNFGKIIEVDGYEWNINISRNKVIRIYKTLEENGLVDKNNEMIVLLYAVTKNSILNEEEYNIISNSIKSLKMRRQ